MKLKGKVIVVTGSSRGIGRAIAEECARQGAKVVISSRNTQSVKKTCSGLEKEKCDIAGMAADVSKESDIKKLFAFALKKYGTIDVWINNAGLSGGYRYLQDIPEKEIRSIIDTNVTGMLLSCKLVIPYFLKNKKGVIINLSGRGGKLEPSPNMAVYAASKAAVTSMSKSLAAEYKKYPISIHALIPGMVETDFYKDTPVSPGLKEQMRIIPILLKAYGTPIGEVAKAAAKIASQKPGRRTGKLYILSNPLRMFTAMPQMMTAMVKPIPIKK